jgi:hypothetical protein
MTHTDELAQQYTSQLGEGGTFEGGVNLEETEGLLDGIVNDDEDPPPPAFLAFHALNKSTCPPDKTLRSGLAIRAQVVPQTDAVASMGLNSTGMELSRIQSAGMMTGGLTGGLTLPAHARSVAAGGGVTPRERGRSGSVTLPNDNAETLDWVHRSDVDATNMGFYALNVLEIANNAAEENMNGGLDTDGSMLGGNSNEKMTATNFMIEHVPPDAVLRCQLPIRLKRLLRQLRDKVDQGDPRSIMTGVIPEFTRVSEKLIAFMLEGGLPHRHRQTIVREQGLLELVILMLKRCSELLPGYYNLLRSRSDFSSTAKNWQNRKRMVELDGLDEIWRRYILLHSIDIDDSIDNFAHLHRL